MEVFFVLKFMILLEMGYCFLKVWGLGFFFVNL